MPDTTAETTTTTADQVHELGRRWVAAEEAADLATLDTLTTENFTLVGPVGFVLTKDQWLQRYRGGGFTTHKLTWDETAVRDYGDTAVVIGRHTQEASMQGNRVDGSFRATHILVRDGAGWRLAGMHLSPIGGPLPFTPPKITTD